MKNKRNPYEILGVTPKDSSDDIKKAFRKLSLKWHPDKNPSKEASATFAEIPEAWEELSDPVKRQALDEKLAKARIESIVPVAKKAVDAYLDGLVQKQ